MLKHVYDTGRQVSQFGLSNICIYMYSLFRQKIVENSFFYLLFIKLFISSAKITGATQKY